MKKIIYTAIFNGYDELTAIKEPGWQCICFTDNPDMQAKGWEIVHIAPQPKLFRKIKTCPHLFLPDHDISVWLDGNLSPKMPMDHIVKNKTGYWLMEHPMRKCAYKEGQRCIELNKDNPDTINEQLARYRKEKYPENSGMVATGVVIRTPGYEKFGELWWSEIEKGSVRDQLSWNYCQWKTGIKYKLFPFLQNFSKVVHESKRKPAA